MSEFELWLLQAIARNHGAEAVKISLAQSQTYKTLIAALLNRLAQMAPAPSVEPESGGQPERGYESDPVVLLYRRLLDEQWRQIKATHARNA